MYVQRNVFMDHYALYWLINVIETLARITRCRIHLVEYTFEIKYKRGKENQFAYEMQRIQYIGEIVISNEDDITSLNITH